MITRNLVLLLLLIYLPLYIAFKNDLQEIKLIAEPYIYNCQNCKDKYYKFIIEAEAINNYLNIELENESNIINTINSNYIIAFSNEDEECHEREQLSQGTDNVQMWLTKDQIKNNNNYLYISCSSSICNYKLTLTLYDIIKIDFNTQITFYITEKNKDLEINFKSDSLQLEEAYEYITLWALGNKNIQANLNLNDNFEYEKYINNYIYKIKNNLNKNEFNFKLTLSCEVGDTINIGSNIKNINYYNELYINQVEIKGFLTKAFYNEECYEIVKDNNYFKSNKFFLNGIIYNKIAEIYYKDINNEEIKNTINIINNGSFVHKLNQNSQYNYFCIRFPSEEKYDINEIFYSLKLTDLSLTDKNINLYNSQINGEIYQNYITNNEIFILNKIPTDFNYKKMTFGIISQLGSIEVYSDECINYPLCDYYDDEKLKTLNQVQGINGNFFYTNSFRPSKSPIDSRQNVLIIKCANTDELIGECLFKSMFLTDIDKIKLLDGQSISKYIDKGEKDNFKIDYANEGNIDKIIIELMIFSGDVSIIFNSNPNCKKNFNVNKIVYTIEINSLDIIMGSEIDFSVYSLKNSFYNIKYILIRNNGESNIIENIEPGMSYLITMDPEINNEEKKEKNKIVRFSDLNKNMPALINFYSINCKINVNSKMIDEKANLIKGGIESFGQYYQDIISLSYGKDYEYILQIIESDSSNYNNKLCMIYASSTEFKYLIKNNDEDDKENIINEKQIIISNGEPKQIIFSKYLKIIEYLYPHVNVKNDIIIKFNLIDMATYKVTIFFSNQKVSELNYIQTGNDLIYLHKNEWKDICKDNDICPIIIQIKLFSIFVEKEPNLLISVNEVQDNLPTYIEKNKINIDFLLGNNHKYYYTDLGQFEEGEVTLNFRRGCGRIYAKIVKKMMDEPKIETDWRGTYKLPNINDNSLEYNGYTNKIIIRKNETQLCKDGCYLLLSLQISIISEVYSNSNYNYREHPFTILIHTNTKSSENLIKNTPIINIPLNEFIIGNLNNDYEDIYEYYSVYFNHDSHKIIIDFQSKYVNYYINIGNIKPKLNSFDFSSDNNNKQNNIFEISKKEVLEICNLKKIKLSKNNSLKGLSMTIGLYTPKKNVLYSNYYTLKIHLPINKEFEIHEVNSDQKTLCKTSITKNNINRCLFVIFYLGIDSINHLLLYPLIQDHSPYEMYANFIWQENYENFDYSYIKSKIPDSNSIFSTKKSKLNYIYIDHGEQYDMYLLVSVITKSPTTVELLSSFYTKDIKLSPNPYSFQLFGIKNDHFLFEFPIYDDFIINIESITGEGKIYFENDKNIQYILNGNNDRISLTCDGLKNDKKDNYKKLYIETKNDKDNTLKDKFPGFLFYMNYELKNSKLNMVEIPFGKSTKISYNNTALPVYIYSLVPKLDNDINIFINLYELIGESYSKLSKDIPFEIKATLVNESSILQFKSNHELLNNLNYKFNGIFDPMINIAYILIKREDILNKYSNYLNNPVIIIKVSKSNKYSTMKVLNKINIESTIIQDNSNIPITPNIYQYGKLSSLNAKNIYKLKTDKSQKYMRIQFSANNLNMNYTINIYPEISEKIEFKDYTAETIYGKSIIIFDSEPERNHFIYLIIYHDNNNQAKESNQNTNYVFNYMDSDNINDFKFYIIKDTHIEFDKKNDYTISLYPITGYENLDISYFIKFVSKEDYIKEEVNNTIALRESKCYVQEFNKNNLIIENEKIILKVSNIDDIEYKYIQVIARIKGKNNIEFFSYESISLNDSNNEKMSDRIIDIILGMLLLIIYYCIYRCVKKRRNMSSEIEKTDINKNDNQIEVYE